MKLENYINTEQNIQTKTFKSSFTNNQKINSDFVRTPDTDRFENKVIEKKKNSPLKKILLGSVSTILLLYGGIVLKNKLTKPSLEEVQNCFRKIFNENLNNEQIEELIKKYKSICTNQDSEKFSKEIIEQLKKDYSIEETQTTLKFMKSTSFTDNNGDSIKNLGKANPFGEIKIYLKGNEKNLEQETLFATHFHELKHIKQFTIAYRSNPEEFAKAIFNNNKQENIKNQKDIIRKYCQKIKNKDTETYKNLAKLNKCSIEDISKEYQNKTIEEIEKKYYKNFDIESSEKFENYIISRIKEDLEKTYGKLKPFKKDSKEYKQGMAYIKAYSEYPNIETDFEAYKNNLLEQEAFKNGDFATKIYNYLTKGSIWKI